MQFKNFLVLVLSLFVSLCFAQNTSKQIKKAETSAKSLSYGNTIEIYDGILKKSKGLSPEELQKIKLNLAEAYYFVKDYKNAERYYAEGLANNPVLKGDELKAYQRYAQVLNSNGNRAESIKIWTKYTDLQENDKRGVEFTKLYKNMEPLTP